MQNINKKSLAIFISVVVIVLILVVAFYFNSTKANSSGLNNIDISIDNIPANKVVCVGKIEIVKGSEYLVNITSKTGSYILVALNESDKLTDVQGIEWKQYYGNSGNVIEAKFTDANIGVFYVYVGSKGDELAEVKGTILNK